METVGDRLTKAQASGDINEIRAALMDAKAAGADPAQIEQALAEVERMARGGAASAAPGETAKSPQQEPDAAALRAQAEGHKKRGNERLKDNTKSAAREAMECFTTGLEVRCSDNVLNAQLYSNRAHVRILLRQFVEAVDDCRKAIECDPKNMKAYWRGAKASMHLDLCKNAISFCEAGLQKEPNDADLMKLKGSAAEKLAGQQRRRAELSAASTNQEFNADEAMALQERVNSLTEQVGSLKASTVAKQRELMKLDLTLSNLGDVPSEAATYVAVGRGFLKKDREYVDSMLAGMHQTLETDIPKLTKTLQELEKRKEAAEQELKEMVQAFKHQSDASQAQAA